MPTIVTRIDERTKVQIEAEAGATGYQETAATPQMLATKAEQAFTDALRVIEAISRRLSGTMEQVGDHPPDSLELTFGVKFTAAGDVWVAKASGEAQITAKVVWKGK